VRVRPTERDPQGLVQLLERLIFTHGDRPHHGLCRPVDERCVRNEHCLKCKGFHRGIVDRLPIETSGGATIASRFARGPMQTIWIRRGLSSSGGPSFVLQ
jgi:hypothetical protein